MTPTFRETSSAVQLSTQPRCPKCFEPAAHPGVVSGRDGFELCTDPFHQPPALEAAA